MEEERTRRKEKLSKLIENVYDSIAMNQIIKDLAILRGVKGNDLETKLKACDKAIEDDTKYLKELEILLSNENSK